jgi:GNAT superfamily N-acetyltransferase
VTARWGDVVEVRPPKELERARELVFILSSWSRSWVPHTRPPLELAQVNDIVDRYHGRCDRVLVAVPPGVERVICGWVARLSPGVLGYLYVAHDYRRQGIGERLMLAAGINPRGERWRYVFGTPRLRKLCRPDPRRPDRVPWRGVPHGKDQAAPRR